MDVESIQTPEQLAEMLTGLSDSEVVATVGEMGTDTVLDRIFEEMSRRFDAGKAGGQRAVINWIVNGLAGEGADAERRYVVRVTGDACSAERGNADDADISLTTGLPVFLRLVSGTVNGTTAFMNGQLTLTGNVMTAMAMQAWFGI